MDLLQAGGLPLAVVLVLGAISVALAAGNLFRSRRGLSRAAAVFACITALCAVAGSALNWYAIKTSQRELQTDTPFAGKMSHGAMATVLLPDPSLPIIYGALLFGLWLYLSSMGKKTS
jgi:hypothetical protein